MTSCHRGATGSEANNHFVRTRIHCLWHPNSPDEPDNHLIELAVAGDADLIVTRHVHELRGAELRFASLQVLSPPDFLTSCNLNALAVCLHDEKHRRLKALVKKRGTPLSHLVDDMTTVMLAEFDAETRFRLRVARAWGRRHGVCSGWMRP
jgi:hypothetical protein